MNDAWGLIIVLAGVFSIAGGAFDWEWFMNHRKARAICWLEACCQSSSAS